MSHESIYERLMEHLSRLGMGYPPREDLLEILRENFSPEEARVALGIPTGVMPLEVADPGSIAQRAGVSRKGAERVLEALAQRGLVFCLRAADGSPGYGLHQVGFGFPQSFFWDGRDTAHSRKMAELIPKYFNRHVTREAYAREIKPYRYIPVAKSIDPDIQAVFPFHMMASVLQSASKFAVCHCSCRVMARLRGRPCEHPTEVCLKFDEMAEYVIDRKLGRQISRQEAEDIVRKSEAAGLVHFVDNAEGDVKHNCNCCGCACWNVGVFKRRKIPRDVLMATYFIRQTDEEECVGCGQCVDICPVDALVLEGDFPKIDLDWCIGCGLCATRCPNGAITMKLRDDRGGLLPAARFKELHQMILKEKT